MSRRMTKAESKAIGTLLLLGLVVGGPIAIIVKLIGVYGVPVLAAWAVAASAAWMLLRWAMKKRRRARLFAKYGDESVVEKIMNGTIWQGQSPEQLRDSLGAPADIDEYVMKTKTKHVWKYHRTGKNRFGLRITFENGKLVGWDEKL